LLALEITTAQRPRPRIPADIGHLIREMTVAKPLVGSAADSRRTAQARDRRRPDHGCKNTWPGEGETFVRNHAEGIASIDLFAFFSTKLILATRSAYWWTAEITHYLNYAPGELLAVFNDPPTEQNSLLSDMRRLVSRIVETDFTSLPEGFQAPSFSEEARRSGCRPNIRAATPLGFRAPSNVG